MTKDNRGAEAINRELLEALEFYREEAEAAQRAMTGTPKPDAMTAIITVLALDGGKRARAAITKATIGRTA